MKQFTQPGPHLLRAVLDTNVLISSLLSRTGAPALVVDAWRAMRFVLILSPAILVEIRTTLRYPRIKDKYAFSDQHIEGFLSLLLRDALVVDDAPRPCTPLAADPSDDKFLLCAAAAQADLIVSGDQHLLRLQSYQGIPIITARQMAQELGLS